MQPWSSFKYRLFLTCSLSKLSNLINYILFEFLFRRWEAVEIATYGAVVRTWAHFGVDEHVREYFRYFFWSYAVRPTVPVRICRWTCGFIDPAFQKNHVLQYCFPNCIQSLSNKVIKLPNIVNHDSPLKRSRKHSCLLVNVRQLWFLCRLVFTCSLKFSK